MRPPRLFSFAALTLGLCACASTTPNLDPVGETFPSVRGNALSGKAYRLPEDVAGKPTVLLVAYAQDAQFDVDRWLLGLIQARLNAQIYEVPTVDGFVPTVLSDVIDDGMRSGIPKDDWGAVVTVYDDGDKIVAFTGNEQPRNCRAILLDADGKVVWFHDEGYSARLVLELEERIAELNASSSPPVGAPAAPSSASGDVPAP